MYRRVYPGFSIGQRMHMRTSPEKSEPPFFCTIFWGSWLSSLGKLLLVSFINYFRKHQKAKYRCEPNWQWEAALTSVVTLYSITDKQWFEEALNLQRLKEGLPRTGAEVTLRVTLPLSAVGICFSCFYTIERSLISSMVEELKTITKWNITFLKPCDIVKLYKWQQVLLFKTCLCWCW